MTPDPNPPPRSTLEYARPGIRPVEPPESDLEHAFGCFPAMAGALLAAWAWGCTVAAWSDPLQRDHGPSEMAVLASAAGIAIGILVVRRSSGAFLGIPLILACAGPIGLAGRNLLGW